MDYRKIGEYFHLVAEGKEDTLQDVCRRIEGAAKRLKVHRRQKHEERKARKEHTKMVNNIRRLFRNLNHFNIQSQTEDKVTTFKIGWANFTIDFERWKWTVVFDNMMSKSGGGIPYGEIRSAYAHAHQIDYKKVKLIQ
jgi:hypothetical protein